MWAIPDGACAGNRAMTLAELYRKARQMLHDAGVDAPDLDARLLLETFVGATHADLIARPDALIDADRRQAFESAVARRLAGEPVHRILGFREFYGMKLQLSAGTLEPRPDTETLIDVILSELKVRASDAENLSILDLGTGTGAIALALLKALPRATAVGVDISDDALTTAARNALDNGLEERFEARRSDWFSSVAEKFHVIASNPPYIPSTTIASLSKEVKAHDPLAALDGGSDGLDPYRVIAAEAAGKLHHDGFVAVEIGHDQRDQVVDLFERQRFRLDKTGFDMLGHARALVFSIS